MSIKSILLFTLMAISNYLICQDNPTYSDYVDLVLEASDDISRKNYHQARENYQLAFSKIDVPFSVDLIPALKAAKVLKDTLWIKEICETLAKGGIPIEYFSAFKKHEWYADFKSHFNIYKDFYCSNFDLELRSNLLLLRTQDSIYNESYHKARRGEIETTLKELINGATRVVEGFKKLVIEHGFPSEKRMGYYFEGGEVSLFPTGIVLIHIYQRGTLLYKDELPKLVREGDLLFLEQQTIENFTGFGDSTGIEQEMKIRFEKINENKH